MLSSVLKSKTAIEVNISIIRTFILTKQFLFNYEDLKKQMSILENDMNHKFKDVYEALNYLIQINKKETKQIERKRIGYK